MQAAEARQFFVYKLPLVKGICILGVILIHVTVYATEMTRFGWFSSALIFVNSLTRFAVPLFVTLSGFYLSLNRRNEVAGPFYRRTLKFLLIPYLAYSILYSLPQLLKSHRPWILIKNLLTFDAQSHLWFIALIIQLYLLHPFLSRFYNACKRRGALVFFALILQIAYSSSITALFPHPYSPTFLIRFLTTIFFPSYIGYFLTGYYLLEHSWHAFQVFQRRSSVIIGCLAWIVAGAGISAAWIATHSQGVIYEFIQNELVRLVRNLLTPLMTIGALIAIIAFVRGLETKQIAVRRLLNSLGLYSYSVYFLHILYVRLEVLGLRRAHISPDNALFYFLLLPSTVALTLVSVRWLARLPFARYIT